MQTEGHLIELDWEALRSQAGTRLIVGWYELKPEDTFSSSPPRTLSFEVVIRGTPASVFRRFATPQLGGLNFGMSRSTEEGYWTTVVNPWLLSREGNQSAHFIGRLEAEGDWLTRHDFDHLQFTWGMRAGAQREQSAILAHARHPIAPKSIHVELAFTKHPSGRLVSVTLSNVPSALAEDVEALWQMVMDLNARRSAEAPDRIPSMPWQEWEF